MVSCSAGIFHKQPSSASVPAQQQQAKMKILTSRWIMVVSVSSAFVVHADIINWPSPTEWAAPAGAPTAPSDAYGVSFPNPAVSVDPNVPVIEVQIIGSDVQISFTTAIGANYVVEYNNSLAAGSWSPLASVAGMGDVMTAIDPGDGSLPQRFYRVRLGP
jgi:hypothetical protein